MRKLTDSELKSLHTRITNHLLGIEGLFSRPMQVLLVVHDPDNDECSVMLCNRPGAEMKSCEIVEQRLPGSDAVIDDRGVTRSGATDNGEAGPYG